MAIRCSFPCLGIPCSSDMNKNHVTKVSMAHQSHVPPKRTSTTIIRSFKIKNKVFEDQSSGIVCYIDDAGEVICEGYDEGPRYSGPPLPELNDQRLNGLRELPNIDFLHPNQLRIQVLNSQCIKMGVASQDDWPDFNNPYGV
ncbi:uncharacterized protein LOC131252182 isoform X2 [Magnolia sinica]|uniref:uncharacterized protein LOC131252182 isoform X2 n=1 Tax=Magnolia sinica TaxID=86752 RepID=UPI00265881BF|nr:uncharacterized protein LOC131252182 isoform X2 [Magnolia sinica]